MIYFKLFIEFFKTGLFATGGGLATLPFLTEMTTRYDWFTKAQLADMVAVAESTPGPIGVNTATFAGYNAAGVLGALTATFALVLPSYIVLLLISKALSKYKENPLVQSAFSALRPAATGLIAAACITVLSAALTGTDILGVIDLRAALLFAVLMLLTNLKKLKGLHPIIVIAASAVAGIALGL